MQCLYRLLFQNANILYIKQKNSSMSCLYSEYAVFHEKTNASIRLNFFLTYLRSLYAIVFDPRKIPKFCFKVMCF